MTHAAEVVDGYVQGDRQTAIVDVDITSLDEEGFENWDPHDHIRGEVLECWPVGRETGLRQVIRWDAADGERLHVTKANGNLEQAGSEVGRVRFRVVSDR